MKRYLTIIITTATIISILRPLEAQVIQPLNYNHALINELEDRPHAKSLRVVPPYVYEGEYFEDFAGYHFTSIPRGDRWEDISAFINSTFATSMVSVGVATLDAIDSHGYPYYTSINKVVPSDTLTSGYFEFNYAPLDSTWFSFYYQAGGLGDTPEGIDTANGAPGTGRDTLLLDFFRPITGPDSGQWENVFWTLDDTDPEQFKQVILRVDTSYLKDGFRFRFRNYTSAEASNIQGKDLGYIGNNDMWHIDYIRMTSGADSTDLLTIKDIVILEELKPTLQTYTSVPYSHLPFAQVLDERTTIPFTFYTGNFDLNSIDTERTYRTIDLKNNSVLKNPLRTNTLPTDSVFALNDFLTVNFPYREQDSLGWFEVQAFIETSSVEQYTINDTLRRREVYYDHYAYDDGTAEFSFGILGEEQDLNQIAYRFRYLKRTEPVDSLRAVLIYFAKSINSETFDAAYQISIRGNDGNLPGAENLYESEELLLPDYDKGLNKFTRIPIEPAVAVTDTFFVIITQLNGYVGIGYDINNNRSNQILTRTVTGEGFGWQPVTTGRKGALMVRPSFRKYDVLNPVEQVRHEMSGIAVYPNPARNILHIDYGESDARHYQLTIYNMIGVVQQNTGDAPTALDISQLEKGLYVLRVSDPQTGVISTLKFIKE